MPVGTTIEALTGVDLRSLVAARETNGAAPALAESNHGVNKMCSPPDGNAATTSSIAKATS
jgi:hypothetical protein